MSALRRLDQRLFLLFVCVLPIMFVGHTLHGAWVIPADAIFVAAAITWAVRRPAMRFTFFHAALGAYALAVVVSAALASRLLGCVIDLYVVAIALLSYEHARDPAMERPTVFAWLYGGALTIAACAFEIALFYAGVRGASQGFGSLPPGPYPRVVGLFLNFNAACNYLSIVVLFALLAAHREWLSLRAQNWFWVGLAVSMGFTVSPGIGGALLGIGLWFWVAKKSGQALAAGILAAAAVVVATSISPLSLAPSSRAQCWGAAVSYAGAHPLFGLGPGAPLPCPPWTDPSGNVQLLTDAHQLYLSIAAHAGIPALLALLAAVVWSIRRSRPWSLAEGRILSTTLAIALVEALLYQGLSGSFEHQRHLFVLLGTLAAIRIQ